MTTNEEIMAEQMKLRTDFESLKARIDPIFTAYRDGLPICSIESIRMKQVENKFVELQTEYEEKLKKVDSDIKKVEELLRGNGKPGLILTVDRIEQSMNFMKWIGGAILLAAIGQLVFLIFSPFTG